jgi:hypothetical protein
MPENQPDPAQRRGIPKKRYNKEILSGDTDPNWIFSVEEIKMR